MTKKELLENELFKAMPDNTKIVFNTSHILEDCRDVRFDDLSFRSEIVKFIPKADGTREPLIIKAMVINTNPY